MPLQPQQKRLLQKLGIYSLGAAVSVMIVGTLLTFSLAMEVMIVRVPDPIEKKPAPEMTLSAATVSRPQPLIIAGDGGVSAAELLIAHEVLGAQAWVVSSDLKQKATNARLDFLPDLTFQTVIANKDRFDFVLVIPSHIDAGNKALLAFLKEMNGHPWITLGEGIVPAIQSGRVQSGRVAGHFFNRESMEDHFENLSFVEEVRWIKNGGVFTCVGGAQTRDCIAAGLGAHFGPKTGFADPQWPTPPEVNGASLLRLFLNGGFSWDRKDFGVAVYQGMSAESLGAILDLVPRSFRARVFTLGETRNVIPTRTGLRLVPEFASNLAPPADYLVIPKGPSQSLTLDEKTSGIAQWELASQASRYDYRGGPASAWQQAQDLVARELSTGDAEFSAQMTQANAGILPETGSGDPTRWLALLLVAGLGVASAWVLESLWMGRGRRA